MSEQTGKRRPIRALTLYQPWATLMAIGAKPDETRGWAAPQSLEIGEALAIHAGLRDPAIGLQELGPEGARAALHAMQRAGIDVNQPPPTGCVLSIHEFRGCRRAWLRKDDLPAAERLFGDYSYGRYAWQLPLLYRLPKPNPCRGHQGLWPWEPTKDVEEWLRDLACAEGGFWEEMRSGGERL